MLDKEIISKYRNDAQGLAKYFSDKYYHGHEKVFPLNPFQVLTDLGIHFVFRNFKNLEGLYMPATSETDVDLVAININRPITRQRFSAAHELCHVLKDADIKSPFMCAIAANDFIERYAESFASAFLMPLIRYGMPPFYIKVEKKEEYYAALEIADKKGDFNKLFDYTMRALMQSHAELAG